MFCHCFHGFTPAKPPANTFCWFNHAVSCWFLPWRTYLMVLFPAIRGAGRCVRTAAPHARAVRALCCAPHRPHRITTTTALLRHFTAHAPDSVALQFLNHLRVTARLFSVLYCHISRTYCVSLVLRSPVPMLDVLLTARVLRFGLHATSALLFTIWDWFVDSNARFAFIPFLITLRRRVLPRTPPGSDARYIVLYSLYLLPVSSNSAFDFSLLHIGFPGLLLRA